MIERLFFLAIQSGAAFAVVLPLAIHWFLNRRWMKAPPSSPEACKDEDLPFLCIVIPTWNESRMIESKLDNLIAQRYPSSRRRLGLVDWL